MIALARWREDNAYSRLDSEFQKRSYLHAVKFVRKHGVVQLKEHIAEIIHPQEIIREYVDAGAAGVWFLRAQNVRPLRVDAANQVFISAEDAKALPQNAIRQGDILITRTGANRGDCAFYDRDEAAVASSHTFILRTKDLDPEYLTIFMNSDYGRKQIDKGVYGAVQPEIAPYYLKNIWIPKLSGQLNQRVSDSIARTRVLRLEAEALTRAAELSLLSALGLADWTPPQPLAYSARSSDVFVARRLDAQYYRPKFRDVHARLEATGHAIVLGEMLTFNARGRQPEYAEDGVPVINSKHVRTNRVELDDDNRLATDEGSPVFIQYGDLLLNGTGVGTIGRAAPYLHSARGLPDNHVTVLRTKSVDPIFLSVFLNSPLGQLQIERHIKGSSGQIELYPDDIAKILVWNAPQYTQQDVRSAVLAAFDQERRANALLNRAKCAVEIAIEDSEAAALRFLDEAGA